MKPSKIEKIFFFIVVKSIYNFKPKWATKIQYFFYKRWGMKFIGTPNYISAKVWFDGTDYSIIEIGNQVTISNDVTILTHDWALHTIAKAFELKQDVPIGILKGIKIGDYSFIGLGSILMPGCEIGKGCIIAAGSIVRGKVPDFSIYGGSPGEIIGNSKEYLIKKLNQKGIKHSIEK